MLKPLTITVCLLLAALALGACKKGAHTPQPPPGYPTAAATTPMAMPTDPSTLKKYDKALEKSGVTDQHRTELMTELEKQAPHYGFKLSDDKQYLQTRDEVGTQGTLVDKALLEASNFKTSSEAAVQIKMYFEQTKSQLEQAQKQAEETSKGLARIDQGEIIEGMMPATDPAGVWHSLGETREGEKHFLVEHDDQYYKELFVDDTKKTLRYQEFKDGKIERDTTLPYKYDPAQGQLTTQSAGGGPGDAFVVMELPNYPDRIFVRPMYDTVFAYTVYRRLGKTGLAPVAAAMPKQPSGGK